MYKLNLDLITGYLSIVDIHQLQKPFKKEEKLHTKYASGWRWNSIPYNFLKKSYSDSNPILDRYLIKCLDEIMITVNSSFKDDYSLNLKEIDSLTDELLILFLSKSSKILSSKYYIDKCDVIFDYFGINVNEKQRNFLQISNELNIIEKIEVGSKVISDMDLLEKKNSENTSILKKQIDSLREDKQQLKNQIFKIKSEKETQEENSFNQLEKYKKEINMMKSHIKELDEQIENYNNSQKYGEEIQNKDTAVSFCIYGSYIPHSGLYKGEEQLVAYRIADIYNNSLVEKKTKDKIIRFVSFSQSNQKYLSFNNSDIWEFDINTGHSSKKIDELKIIEIVKSTEKIIFDINSPREIGEKLGKGISFKSNPITDEFLIILNEIDSMYIAILVNKSDWKTDSEIWHLNNFNKKYSFYYIKKIKIYIQHDEIRTNDVIYNDKMFIIKNKNNVILIDDSVDVIYGEVILNELFNKIRTNYITSRADKKKYNKWIGEVNFINEIDRELNEKYREELLTNTLLVTNKNIAHFDDILEKLVLNHPYLNSMFIKEVEKVWKDSNQKLIDNKSLIVDELQQKIIEKESIFRDVLNKTKIKSQEFIILSDKLSKLKDDVAVEAKLATENATNIITQNAIFKALINNNTNINSNYEKNYHITEAKEIKDIEIIDDIIGSISLDNLDNYGYSELNETGDDFAFIFDAIVKSKKIPLIISSDSAKICNSISIGIYGNTCTIIDLDNSIKNSIYPDYIDEKVNLESIVLFRDVIGGIKEEYIINVLRNQASTIHRNIIALSCETKEMLRFAPSWLFNYVIVIDMEECFLKDNDYSKFEKCKNYSFKKKNNKNINILEGLYKLLPNNKSIFKSRNDMLSELLIYEGNVQLAIGQLLRYDLIPICNSFDIGKNKIIETINNLENPDIILKSLDDYFE